MNRILAALAAGFLALVSGCFYAPMVSPEVLEPSDYCAGFGLYGAVPSRLVGQFGWSSIYGRHGLAKGSEFGFGYSYPLGFYVDAKRQLLAGPGDEATPTSADHLRVEWSQLLAAADLCLSVDNRASLAVDSAGEQPRCWVAGIAPSFVTGTADLYGGAQVLVQCEIVRPRPGCYVFPGLIGGASLIAADNPFRIVPSVGLFLDPGLNRRPVQVMVTAGVALQFDLSDLSEF